MSPNRHGVVVGALLSALVMRSSAAQCPDGTAPPCRKGAPEGAATSRPPAERDRARPFLVLPFRNLSRSADYQWLVEASPTMLADALGQWTELTGVPDERLYPALRRHELHPGDVMDLASLRRVAAETGGWTAVTGEIIVTGARLHVSARAYDLVTRRQVARTTFEGRATDDVRRAYDQIATVLLRAAALSNRLPPRAASHVRALRSLLNADFTAARTELAGLVAQDSNDVDALEELAGLEFLVPLLLPTPAGEQRRGSLNAATRLSRRVLDLDPTRHGAYQG